MSGARGTPKHPAAGVFRQAARRKEASPHTFFGSCMYICVAADDAGLSDEAISDLQNRYKDVFCPKWHYGGSFWWDNADDRIVALCFMAAMVEAGDA